MSRDIAPFGVRMPPELKSRIEEAANKSGRSINAEIVARLQESFEPNLASISWPDLVRLLHTEAQKRGTPISVIVGHAGNKTKG